MASYEEFLKYARDVGDDAYDQRAAKDAFWGARWLAAMVGTIVLMDEAVKAQAVNEDLLSDESLKRAIGQRGQILAYRQILSNLYQLIEQEQVEDERPDQSE